jgi:hypothetical protein
MIRIVLAEECDLPTGRQAQQKLRRIASADYIKIKHSDVRQTGSHKSEI